MEAGAGLNSMPGSRYNLQQSGEQHVSLLRAALLEEQDQTDLVFFTEDGLQVACSSRVIGMFSSFIRGILRELPTCPVTVVSVPFTCKTMAILINIVTQGFSPLVLESEEEIYEAAEFLFGIDSDSFSVRKGKGEKLKKKKKPDKKLPVGLVKEEDGESGDLNISSLLTPVKAENMFSARRGRKPIQFPGIVRRDGHAKPFQCVECGKEYSTRDHLRRHIKTIHQAAPRTSQTCTECGKAYSSKDHLKRHMKTAHGPGGTGSRPYRRRHKPEEQAGGVAEIAGQDEMTCGWCDRNFTSVDVLQDHIIQEHSIKAEMPDMSTDDEELDLDNIGEMEGTEEYFCGQGEPSSEEPVPGSGAGLAGVGFNIGFEPERGEERPGGSHSGEGGETGFTMEDMLHPATSC